MYISDLLQTKGFHVWGNNSSVGSGAQEELNDFAIPLDQVSIFATAAALDVGSSSTNDAAGQTGALTIRIFGLDANWAFQTDDVTMTGQTKIVGTKTWKRVFGAEVLTAGTGLANAGDIYIIKTGTGGTWSGGVPPTLTSGAVKILAGLNTSMNGMFCTPVNTSLRLKTIYISGRTQVSTMYLYVCDNANDAITKLIMYYNLGAGDNQAIDINLLLGPKTDVVVKAIGGVAGAINSVLMRFEP